MKKRVGLHGWFELLFVAIFNWFFPPHFLQSSYFYFTLVSGSAN